MLQISEHCATKTLFEKLFSYGVIILFDKYRWLFPANMNSEISIITHLKDCSYFTITFATRFDNRFRTSRWFTRVTPRLRAQSNYSVTYRALSEGAVQAVGPQE